MSREPSALEPGRPDSGESPADRGHILVVDDEASMTTLVHELLEEAGYDVAVASDGPACIEHCQQRTPDLILLDICMPGMNGFEVCQALKQKEHTAQVPIVLLSALAEPEHRVRGFALGIFDYLTKPFSNEELLARTENILARQRLLQSDFEASKLDTVRQLSVTLADRINNPLAGILACCQILSKSLGDRDDLIEALDVIARSVHQIYAALVSLTSAREVKSTEYSQGVRMIDVPPPCPKTDSPEP